MVPRIGAPCGAHAPRVQRTGAPWRWWTPAWTGFIPVSTKDWLQTLPSKASCSASTRWAPPPLAANFPKRNRLIAALGLGTLVVEAALPSGSLITARMALDLGRDVLAIPGSIDFPQSHGCHALIRQGAKLVETAQDVIEELQLVSPQLSLGLGPASDASNPSLGEHATTADTKTPSLLGHLGFAPVSLDALQARGGLDTAGLQAQLLTLELEGRVASLPGGLFQQLASG